MFRYCHNYNLQGQVSKLLFFNDPLRKEFVHSCYYDEQKLYLSFATHSYDFSTHSHIEIYCTHVLLSFNNYNIQDCDMHEAGYKM